MNVCFRVDSSTEIGTGHVFRCLTLAEQLREQGWHVLFAQRMVEGNLLSFIRERGFSTFSLIGEDAFEEKEDAEAFVREMENLQLDWVVVDHYQLSAKWERYVADKLAVEVTVIDDLANREHECSLFLDQNYVQGFESRYLGLLPSSCKTFLGPSYLLLRSEFFNAMNSSKREEQRLLIFFGGSDPTNETEKVMLALFDFPLQGWHIDVVVGTANPRRDTIKTFATQLGVHYHCQIDYLAELMSKATFSFGAGGVTMWERCFLGLPSFVTIVAENQRQSTVDASAFGAVSLLGWHSDVTSTDYLAVLKEVLNNKEKLDVMREKGKELIKFKTGQTMHPVVKEMVERSKA